MNKKEIVYNDNITLLLHRTAMQGMKLADDEYVVHMIFINHYGQNDIRNFFDRDKGWLGLERTVPSGIYITKAEGNYAFDNRGRGIPLVARVKDPDECCLITH